MIVFCNVEECRHNKKRMCGCVWPSGIEAIEVQETPFGVECMDVDMRHEEEEEKSDE